jgi:hypothetical protein
MKYRGLQAIAVGLIRPGIPKEEASERENAGIAQNSLSTFDPSGLRHMAQASPGELSDKQKVRTTTLAAERRIIG